MRNTTTLKWLLISALATVGVLVAWSAIASGAGPYKNKATFVGNGKACGSEKKTGCAFNSKTVTPLEFRITIGAKEARLECQEENKATGWNPPGTEPQQNDSIDALSLSGCKVVGFSGCKVSVEVSGLPWVTIATEEAAEGPYADQLIIPAKGLRFNLSGECPVPSGAYGISGEVDADTVIAHEVFCEPVKYINCTYEQFEGKGSGVLKVENEKGSGTATVGGEFFIYCTSGGACNEKENQITLK